MALAYDFASFHRGAQHRVSYATASMGAGLADVRAGVCTVQKIGDNDKRLSLSPKFRTCTKDCPT